MYNSWVFSLPSMSDIVHVSGQFQDFYINGSFILEKGYRIGEEVVELYYLFSLGMEGTKGFRLSLRDLQLDR